VKKTADVTGGKPIAVLLQSISGVSAINPLVAFYDIHGGKREALFFYFVPDTTRDLHTKSLVFAATLNLNMEFLRRISTAVPNLNICTLIYKDTFN
jgi:hypothetical protein